MTDNWVGFRSIPPRDRNRKLEKRKFDYLLDVEGPKVINNFLKWEQFESWFGTVEKFDARQGGRISFTRDQKQFHGAFSRIQIPKQIILVTELHGEISMQLREGRQTKVILRFQKALLRTELDDWLIEVDRVVAKFLESLS